MESNIEHPTSNAEHRINVFGRLPGVSPHQTASLRIYDLHEWNACFILIGIRWEKPVNSGVRTLYISWCVLALACSAEAASPTLSISLVPPASVRFSWPSNFTDWQLTSTTNLSSTLAGGDPDSSHFEQCACHFIAPYQQKRLLPATQTNSGGCVFQATPPVITSGSSSTLTWCPVAGTTYRISPGPGVVTGGGLVVSPTTTTVYTLTASNTLGVTTNFTAVIVNPCGFASVSNWNATLTFTYTLTPSAPGYVFSISRHAQVTMHLTPFGSGVFAFDGSASGTASINDREDDTSSGSLITTTTIGTNSPNPVLSTFTLGINCASNSYNFAAIVAVDAIDTETSIRVSSSPRTAITGQVAVYPHPLPVADSTITGSAVLPVVGPFTFPTSDYYTPNDIIANDMWINGVITDATAGTATVSWRFRRPREMLRVSKADCGSSATGLEGKSKV